MDFTHADLDSLGDKLDTLDLTDNERAALAVVLQAAADDSGDVTGFAYDLNPNDLSFKALVHATTPGHKLAGGRVSSWRDVGVAPSVIGTI